MVWRPDTKRAVMPQARSAKHQYPALHQAAAVMVLVLRDQRKFRRAVDDPLPQRPDQMHETRGLEDGPAGGLELLRGLVRHVVCFQFWRSVRIAGSHFIKRRRIVVKRDDQAVRPCHKAEY